MTDKDLISKLANVPMARPGFDALGMSAPVLVQMNPEGKWENCKPGSLDEERLKAKESGKSNYVPVVMMPIYPADKCPFDLDCEIAKMKKSDEKKPTTQKLNTIHDEKDSEKDKDKKKLKKRAFVLQRLTDFDLLSQW
ncbi:hypothetical protein KGM_206121 [Danaus plexippus plexippus]|uniref:Uncharacterized protein n=1 Tax=Danaus plexippus plexippus TaxID=278856 RepID=A0A212EIK0_DANPL|nr:hypothetical protein KGM_206121 [Danaus plexippus plexippus]